MTDILRVNGLSKSYGNQIGCADVCFDVYPGEVLGIVGESGSGKTTLLRCLAGHLEADSGSVEFVLRDGVRRDTLTMDEAERRQLGRTDWAFVHQNPRDGLRMAISAGGNIGERLMAIGDRHYGNIRATATSWLERVEIDPARIDDRPSTFSGGMQQRLQIARNLVTAPRLVFMDEPTGGLDVSVQARLLDLLRGLVAELGIAVIIVTHDLAVVRMLADRMMVMRRGQVVESGLADQVLDDPSHEYTQLLVSSALQV
ncbi:MAG: phosphonate C-P lyase system protein PhnK [Rhodospirillaceae bacterium]|jgi:putative phosphonate transport system ATP-binding protein|nr:phosphonate C-P lyase system protein PhnK [Rhodospirillaceae bacterium]MAS74254.1 phosphonate C-P lyase system protein PhnK [Rhodospirillaceae bacterium]|tara:strand:- start:2668 stop:3438 length:771 start_codon:yes stop_codon:yes gene_type:complete